MLYKLHEGSAPNLTFNGWERLELSWSSYSYISFRQIWIKNYVICFVAISVVSDVCVTYLMYMLDIFSLLWILTSRVLFRSRNKIGLLRMMCIDLSIVRRHRMSVLFCCWDLQVCRTESLQLADICSTVSLFCDTREVELQGTKKANGVLRDVLLRIYQGVLGFEYGVRLYGIHVVLISRKPLWKVWSPLRRFSKNSQIPSIINAVM